MHVLTVAYGHPSDPAAFDRYYETVHQPLAAAVPGVRAIRVLHCAGLDGTPAPYHLVAELTFDSADAVQAGLASPQGQAAAGDLANFADGGATLFLQHD
ncbi:EthD family reductase [Pseudonocardia spirodelae]|uniref:EthD family reductase n=1 Tax=Pseudonocardia spirodelae TaxID=3133431 RepID=A0ABU8TE27_9PSEU